jgi:hypothetical protein
VRPADVADRAETEGTMAETTNDDLTTTEAADAAVAGAEGVVSPDEVLDGV